MTRRLWLAAAALIGLGFATPTTAVAQAAQDCPRGTLDARYCDRDGDLVADLPTDQRQWVNPQTLIFAYTPVEDPSIYRAVWQEFLDHLARETGRRVQFFAVQSNAAQIEAMRAGRLHVAGFNTGSVPLAVNCAGFVPFTMMAARDGRFGYTMDIIVPADSPIQRVEDLRGRLVAFSAQTSNSGYKYPSWLLRTQFGLEEGRDYRVAFSGRHDNSVMGIANRDYDAAPIAGSVMVRMVARGAVDGSRIRVIYRSDPFPTTAYGTAHNLHPELAQRIRAAFASFNWAGTGLEREFRGSEPPQEQFVPITYRTNWAIVRQVDEASGVRYTCR